jgi:hypothetical protein
MTVAARRLDRPSPGREDEPVLAALGEALERLRFGAIALTVHDGRIVQMEITEKRRFDA